MKVTKEKENLFNLLQQTFNLKLTVVRSSRFICFSKFIECCYRFRVHTVKRCRPHVAAHVIINDVLFGRRTSHLNKSCK